MSEPPLKPRDDCQRICVQRRLIAEGPALEPMVMKLDPLHVEAVETEGMHVTLSEAGPVDELDPELVGGVRRTDEVVLVDFQQAVEQEDLRDRRLADPDGADLVGLDQLDLKTGD